MSTSFIYQLRAASAGIITQVRNFCNAIDASDIGQILESQREGHHGVVYYLTQAVSSPKSDPVKAVVGAEMFSCPVVRALTITFFNISFLSEVL